MKKLAIFLVLSGMSSFAGALSLAEFGYLYPVIFAEALKEESGNFVKKSSNKSSNEKSVKTKGVLASPARRDERSKHVGKAEGRMSE